MSGVIFDLENLNPGIWIDYDEEGKAQVCIRICAGDDLKYIRKKTVKKKIEYKNGQRFEFEETNEDLFRELLWDFCIVDWKGFIGKDGKEIECTKENKLLLMGKSIEFAKFLGEALEKVGQENREAIEAEEKK